MAKRLTDFYCQRCHLRAVEKTGDICSDCQDMTPDEIKDQEEKRVLWSEAWY